MSELTPNTELDPNTELELAALADGSLAPEQRAEMLERMQSSPELNRELELQRSALWLLSSGDVTAPESLHQKVATLLDGQHERPPMRQRPARARAWRPFAGASVALATCAALIAILLGGGSSKPSLRDAFALTLRPSTMPAPAERQANRTQLAVSVEGVSFPYWTERFGWRASGARTDRLGGYSVTTVFYSNKQGQRVGYAILAGPALRAQGGTVISRRGVQYRVLSNAGVPVVTWMRAGHACVISGRGLSSRTLVKLAGWSELSTASRGEST
jgi:hypothetical protein